MRLTIQGLTEKVTIFRDFQGPDGCTENLDTESLQHTHLVELDTDVQGTLSTEGEQNTIWSLLFEDVCNIVRSDWQEIDLVGEMVGGLDGCDVGVDEDGVDVALFEGFDGLGSCRLVALIRLALR